MRTRTRDNDKKKEGARTREDCKGPRQIRQSLEKITKSDKDAGRGNG